MEYIAKKIKGGNNKYCYAIFLCKTVAGFVVSSKRVTGNYKTIESAERVAKIMSKRLV